MAKTDRKRIILTGVSRGLGLAMAEALIAGGHTVWGCARSVASLAALRERFGAPHHFEQVDVAEEAQVRRWADAALIALLVAAVTTFTARLRELDGTEVCIGTSGEVLEGWLRVGRDQLRLTDDDGGCAYVPTGSVCWVRPLDDD